MPTDQFQKISERFKRLRQKFGSQKEFAAKTGLKPDQVSQCESGTRAVSDAAIHLMELTINLNRAWLLDGKGSMFFSKKTKNDQVGQRDSIADRIQYIRIDKLLTTEQMAAELNVSKSTLNRYAVGRQPVPDKVVAAIIQKYNVRSEWLFTGKGQPYNTEPEKTRVVFDVASIHQQLGIMQHRLHKHELEIAQHKGRIAELERELHAQKYSRQD